MPRHFYPLFFAKHIPLLREALTRLVFPANCSLCRRLLRLEERSLCPRCLASFERLLLSGKAAHWHKRSGVIQEGFSLYEYGGSFRDFLTHFKFQRQPWLIDCLREPLRKFLLAVRLETRYDALAPIPMTLSRFVERHYNPAEVIAREIGRLSGLPVVQLLKKIYSTPSQHDLSGEERRINLRGCFKVHKQPRPAQPRILLIDDILTTGRTAEEAGWVLKQAGTPFIGVMTLARTLERKR